MCFRNKCLYLSILFCLFLSGCAGNSEGILHGEGREDSQNEQNTVLVSNQDDLSCWEGTYTFFEDYKADDGFYMFMEYNLCVYGKEGKYYADLAIDGQTTAIHLQAQVYGDEEWVSFVFLKELEENAFPWDENERNSVLFSMRREGDVIYTYWGDIYALMYIDNQISGKVYWEKVED